MEKFGPQVLPRLNQLDYKDLTCLRPQIPLRLSFAITIHKIQFFTLNTVLRDFNRRDTNINHAYVLLSQDRKIDRLIFEYTFFMIISLKKKYSRVKDDEIDLILQAQK